MSVSSTLRVDESLRFAGVLAILVTIGGILLATVLDPGFSWFDDALSNLGVRPVSAPIFNGALVLGGGLGLVYTLGLWRVATNRLERLVAGTVGCAMLSMVGVGVFVIGHPLHAPAAVGFYLLVTLAFFLDGQDRNHTTSGRASLGLAIGHVVVWLTYAYGLWPGSGLALPEFVGALLLTGWILWLGPWPVLASRER